VGEPLSLTILHVNDHHSHLEHDDFDYDVSSLALAAKNGAEDLVSAEVAVPYGGFPAIKAAIEQLSSEADHVLKLHAGDAITGTLFYTLFEGEADAAMMNEICFDAFALGNHEFDDGDAGLKTFLDFLAEGDCATPVLAANVTPGMSSPLNGAGLIEPYVIKEIDGQQVGIIGIDIAQKTKNSSNPDEGTEFADETTTAQMVIDELEGMGVDKIIVLTHQGYDNDVEMAGNLDGVDVIVGGDSHTLLGGENVSGAGFNVGGEYPTVVADSQGKTVCVVQAWEYAHVVGKLEVEFDASGDVTSCAGMPKFPILDGGVFEFEFEDAAENETEGTLEAADVALVTDALTALPEFMLVTPDEATIMALETFNEEVEVLSMQEIGMVGENLCLARFPQTVRGELCTVEDVPRGSDISNIVAKAFMTVTPTADFGIQNGGGVRIEIAAGPFTIADAYTLLPFSNTLVTLEMTGQQIKDVLEDALANRLDDGGSDGSYPYASGLRWDVDATQPEDARISNLEVNPRVEGEWQAIDLNATYTVVTNDFIASGRDGYDAFAPIFADETKTVDTFTEYAQGFVDYVELVGTISKLPADEYSTQNYIAPAE